MNRVLVILQSADSFAYDRHALAPEGINRDDAKMLASKIINDVKASNPEFEFAEIEQALEAHDFIVPETVTAIETI